VPATSELIEALGSEVSLVNGKIDLSKVSPGKLAELKAKGLLSDLPEKFPASDEVISILGNDYWKYIDSNGDIDIAKLPAELRRKLNQAVKDNPVLKQ